MTKNIGTTDKAVRIVVAVILVGLYFTNSLTGTPGVIALIVAGIFFLTSLIGVCPLYLPFGISTRKAEKK